MNEFKGLCLMAGLHISTAAQYLGVEYFMIKAWAEGRVDCLNSVFHNLMALIARQEGAIARIITKKISIYDEIGHPSSDHDAQKLGWPSLGVWLALEKRALEEVGKPIFSPPYEPDRVFRFTSRSPGDLEDPVWPSR